MHYVLIVLLLLSPVLSAQEGESPAEKSAEEKVVESKPKNLPPLAFPVELNKCKPQMQGKMSEERVAREAAETKNFSDHEVVTRLIFTEALATGFYRQKCQAPSGEALMTAIGWVIMNRVHRLSPKRDDPTPNAVYNAVFAPGQFRTSFAAAKENPFAKIFLCPYEAEAYLRAGTEEGVKTETFDSVFRAAKAVAAKVMNDYHTSGIPAEYAGISNVFYPFSEFHGQIRPVWAKNADPKKNKGFVNLLKIDENPCAEFYRIRK